MTDESPRHTCAECDSPAVARLMDGGRYLCGGHLAREFGMERGATVERGP